MAYIKGVDVSSFQPDHFDATGSDFAFIKATQSTNYVSPRQSAQASWSRTRGLVTGFYHFLVKGNIQAQAEYFVQKCASIDGDLLACDWETNPASNTYPSSAEKDQFIQAVKKLRPTHRVGLYCNKSFWKSIDVDSYCGDFLWIASPGSAGVTGVENPWVFHQYSISGNMDRNVANFTSRAALASWAHMAETDDDVALSTDDINKIADAVYTKLLKTDGVLTSPADASDHKTNPSWSWQSHVQAETEAARKAAANTDAIIALLKDPAGFVAQLKAELSKVDIKLEVSE